MPREMFGRDRLNRMPKQVAIIVPSTRGEKNITTTAFKNRVKTTRKFMSNLWGGDTTVEAQGGWTDDDGELISETTAVVESYTTDKRFERKKGKFKNFIEQKRKGWKQSSLGFEVDGVFYGFPERDWMGDQWT